MKKNAKNKAQFYDCPVCGYDEMSDAPEAGEVCSSCGTQFDSEDHDRPPHELRSEWIDRDMPWFSRGRKQPKNWSPYRQLINAGHGGDLVIHPRFETDSEFRYAVADAFSDVRMARQLKAERELQSAPLTQAQVAQKAEMKQSRISELESTDYSAWSVSTLRRLAKALGVRFVFGFESWGQLLPAMTHGLSSEALYVPSFEQDFMSQEPERPALVVPQTPFSEGIRRSLSPGVERLRSLAGAGASIPTVIAPNAPISPISLLSKGKGKQNPVDELTATAAQSKLAQAAWSTK